MDREEIGIFGMSWPVAPDGVFLPEQVACGCRVAEAGVQALLTWRPTDVE